MAVSLLLAALAAFGVPQRVSRESSVKNRLTLGREVRLALVAALAGVEPPPMRIQVLDRLGAPKGLVSGGARWVEDRVADDWDAGLKAIRADAPELDAAFAVLIESLDRAGQPDNWRRPTPPLVLRTGRDGRLRAGVFAWSTDRDPFLTALLGQVPSAPRYVHTAPAWPAHLGSLEDVQAMLGVDDSEANKLYRISRDAALKSSTFEDVIRRNLDRSPHGRLANQLLDNAGGLAGFPLAELLHPLLRAAPRWRTPKAGLDFVTVADLGIAGIVGFAHWIPGMPEARPFRRPLAAYLRYLFDYHVAPWNRFGDSRRAHEAFLLYFRTRWIPERLHGAPGSIRALAVHWRRLWPEDYREESEAVTLRRLYRINRALSASSR